MAEFAEVPYSGDRLPSTLALADGIAQKWCVTPIMVKLAREVCRRYGTQTREDESRAVRDWISGRVRYYMDPHGAELVSDPLFTLEHGGDCDDQSTLCACLLRAIGHKAQIAAVQWQGRVEPSHCVCFDVTTHMVLDPISVAPEIWPPVPYRVQRILARMPDGTTQDLAGFFSKAFKKFAKAFQKILPAKTLVGKIADPFGLTNPKRNLKLAGRIADVVGTAATLAVGGWAIGAATTGTAGGFWATSAAGAKYAAAKALLAAKAVGGGFATAAKTIAPMMLTALQAKQQAGQPMTPEDLSYLQQMTPAEYAAAGVDPSIFASGGSGGGGGAGYTPGEYFETSEGLPVEPVADSGIPWGMIAVAAAAGLLLMSGGSGKKGVRRVQGVQR